MPIVYPDKECQARDYSFNWKKTRELFEELLEQNILALPEIKRPDEAGWTDNPNIVYITGWSVIQ